MPSSTISWRSASVSPSRVRLRYPALRSPEREKPCRALLNPWNQFHPFKPGGRAGGRPAGCHGNPRNRPDWLDRNPVADRTRPLDPIPHGLYLDMLKDSFHTWDWIRDPRNFSFLFLFFVWLLHSRDSRQGFFSGFLMPFFFFKFISSLFLIFSFSFLFSEDFSAFLGKDRASYSTRMSKSLCYCFGLAD